MTNERRAHSRGGGTARYARRAWRNASSPRKAKGGVRARSRSDAVSAAPDDWRLSALAGRRRLTEALARLRNDSVLSRPAKASPASRGIVRGFADRAKSLPARVYVGAVLTALLVAIAVNALLLQRGRHPAPLFGPQQPKASPPPSHAASASALSPASIAP